jgi:hypothetical protein
VLRVSQDPLGHQDLMAPVAKLDRLGTLVHPAKQEVRVPWDLKDHKDLKDRTVALVQQGPPVKMALVE